MGTEMTENQLVSIITPSYNQGMFIEETIKSVLYQDYPDIEYIVVDGGSTDGTLEILRKYEGRLRWISEKDHGQSDAINKGFGMARGDIFTWLNSDDTYLSGAVRKAVEFLKAHPQVKMVYGKGYLIDENSKIIGECPTEPFNIERLSRYNYIYQPSAFFRAEVLNTIGMLDENLHYSMDLDLWIRIAKNFKVEYLPEFLATFRLHKDSKHGTKVMAVHKEEIGTFKRHFGKAPANWLYGYVYHVVTTKYPYLKKIRPILLIFVVTYFISEYIKVNKEIPWKVWKIIDKEDLRKFKKDWNTRGGND